MNRRTQENPNSIIMPHLVEMNSKIKVNHNAENQIERSDWFGGRKDNNLDVFRSEGVKQIIFYLNFINFRI